ncbi:MAG TPA: hypothetical protein VGM41_01540 [Chitinophagaceae bacterium]|jgi:hypothetical protein
MKKLLLVILIAFGFTLKGFSQDTSRPKDGQRLEALKIAYLTKRLDLSSEEAQRFWPVYNKYTEEIRAIRRDQRQNNLTELEAEDRILNVRKKYNGEFSRVLSPQKADNFFRSEKDFGGYIQRELQQRRQNNQMNRRPLRP